MLLLAMTMQSHHVFAQSVTITLMPGWNWISVPLMDTFDFETALGSFTPIQGDIIKSQWGNAYYRNGQWVGSISQFYPGYGYHYKSNRTMPVFLTFNAQQSAQQVVVTTSEPMLITAISAMGGGEVTVSDGTYIIVKGLCWAAHENPTTDDFYEESESGVGTFSISMTGLNIATTYYARAYAVTPNGTVYGDQKSFTTLNYVYVDLGLPSGTLWATCNVGAGNPEDYGDYFAWGETRTKDTYDWSTYQYCNGDEYTLTKYCNRSYYGYNGFTDNLTTLLPEDDAATANWGGDWRMPTKAEWQELLDNTTMTGTQQGGVSGRLFTASNGNSIFLPAAGYRSDGNLCSAGSYDYYWSSSLNTGYPYNTGGPYDAWYLYFGSDYCGVTFIGRAVGLPVRPVRSGLQNNAPTGAINGKFTINSNGDQVYFSQGNLQSIGSASTPYWKFADNQWDVLGTTTGQNSSNQNVDRDLFGWGTSGWNNSNMYYQPYDTQSNGNSSQGHGYGPTDGTSYTYNLTGTYANADWGVYNSINNGSNQANQWRTLTQPEWAYIFDTRTTSSGICYAKAKVNDVNGVILLPDDWNSDTYSLSNTNSSSASYSSNTITASQWSTLEQVGAVFLPAAGYRTETSVTNEGSYGGYWSASYSSSYCAGSLYIGFSNLSTDSSHRRYYGFSVRLARVAEN